MKIPLLGPSDKHQGEFRYKVRRYNQQGKFRYEVQAALLRKGNPATRSNEHCSTMKTFTTMCYQQCTIIIFYSYFHKSRTNTKRDTHIQGECCRSSASFLQALTCLNFFDFQIFEYLSFNDFSIVIENSPESNGYPFLSMTQKLCKFLTLDQTKQSIQAYRDPTRKIQEFF